MTANNPLCARMAYRTQSDSNQPKGKHTGSLGVKGCGAHHNETDIGGVEEH